MTIDEIIVLVVGTGLIAFVWWYFLAKRVEAQAVSGSVDIIAKGGYSPEAIKVPVGETTTLNFMRKTPSSCLEEVVIPDFKIKKFLPEDETVSIEITPEKAGEYEFACGMNMYHGKIIAK